MFEEKEENSLFDQVIAVAAALETESGYAYLKALLDAFPSKDMFSPRPETLEKTAVVSTRFLKEAFTLTSDGSVAIYTPGTSKGNVLTITHPGGLVKTFTLSPT